MSSPWELKPSLGGDAPAAIEAGNYPAILVALVDLGTQESEYKGVVHYRRELFLAWEIPGEEGAPVLGRSFAASLTPKSNLGKWLAALSKEGRIPPEGIDLRVLLGKPCLLQVSAQTKQTENGERTYNALVTVSRMPKGMAVPAAKRKHVVIGLDDEIPDWLPRSYGRLLGDIRSESAEKHSTTQAKYEAWKKAPRVKAPAANQQVGQQQSPPPADDEMPGAVWEDGEVYH